MDHLQEETERGAPPWVVTFGDMMTLLLCVFVMLLAFSQLQAQRFKVLAGSLRNAFGVQTDLHYTGVPSGNNVLTDSFATPEYRRVKVFQEISQILKTLKSPQGVEVTLEEDGVRLRMGDGLLFSTASSRLEPPLMPLLGRVGEVIKSSGGKVTVEGHTDDRPIESAAFPSNWELSSSRAGAVVRYLESRGIPGSRLQAAGFADTRPLDDNTTPEGRQKNRRVEILIRTDA